MTARIKDLKEPPLLQPPAGGQSLWLEVAPHHIAEMRKQLQEYAGHSCWSDFTRQAALMERLGIDVSNDAGKHKEGIKEKLGKYVKDGDWAFFAYHAMHMKTLALMSQVKWRNTGNR
jgi:hypothetical protein